MEKRKFEVKPFLKWVGGKTQLISDLEKKLPKRIAESGIIERYIEPFVGGGAFFFYLKSKYKVKKSYLIDNNEDLILSYRVIQNFPEELISEIKVLENYYLRQNDQGRADYYYYIRDRYNKQKGTIRYKRLDRDCVRRSAFMIFLNKTCFNGLFRQNSSGGFNVPHGRYKNPKICNVDNILEVSHALKDSKIICGDFSECRKYIRQGALVYFDPPYRPLNTTSSFTAYTKDKFCDNEQLRLANLYREISQRGVFVLLSNSDPTNENEKDHFFDDIYRDFNIQRVMANRMVNCNGGKRGQIKELLIANY